MLKRFFEQEGFDIEIHEYEYFTTGRLLAKIRLWLFGGILSCAKRMIIKKTVKDERLAYVSVKDSCIKN